MMLLVLYIQECRYHCHRESGLKHSVIVTQHHRLDYKDHQ